MAARYPHPADMKRRLFNLAAAVSLGICVAAILGPATSLLGKSDIPELKGDAFGHQYDELFHSTTVYAQVSWLQLFYCYSGDAPAQPPPGWIRLDTKPDDMWDTDSISFRLSDDAVIQSQGYPYFAITLEQARRISQSPEATAIAVREGTTQKRRWVVETPLSRDQQRLIGQLADYGSEWKLTSLGSLVER
jgi:hypothetical protein